MIERKAGTSLTFAQVCVDAHVARRAREALVFPVRDVFFGLWVDVLFGKPKVDNMDGVLPLAARPPDQEVLRLHVSVYQAPGVDVLHSRDLVERQEKREDETWTIFKLIHSNLGRGMSMLLPW